MKQLIRIVPAAALVFIFGGCSSMNHDTSGSESQMHRADANCPPDKVGSAAGQGTNCRNDTGGASSTPSDSSNSNEPETTTPRR